LAYKIQTPGNYPEERIHAFICIFKIEIFSYYTLLYQTAGISAKRLKKVKTANVYFHQSVCGTLFEINFSSPSTPHIYDIFVNCNRAATQWQ
jgi:hypothetical protein